jgi:hypothetical protein
MTKLLLAAALSLSLSSACLAQTSSPSNDTNAHSQKWMSPNAAGITFSKTLRSRVSDFLLKELAFGDDGRRLSEPIELMVGAEMCHIVAHCSA